MNCTEFRTAIAAAVEGRRLPTLETAAHLEDCRDAECRACWEECALVDRAIVRWRESAASRQAGSVDAVVAAYASEDGGVTSLTLRARGARSASTHGGGAGIASRRDAAAMRRFAAVAVAAAVLIGLLVIRPVDRRQSDAAIAGGATAGDARLAYVSYAQDAAQIVTDAVVLTLGDSSEMEDPRIAPPRIGWEGTWTTIGEGMDAALQDLWDAPPADAPPG